VQVRFVALRVSSPIAISTRDHACTD